MKVHHQTLCVPTTTCCMVWGLFIYIICAKVRCHTPEEAGVVLLDDVLVELHRVEDRGGCGALCHNLARGDEGLSALKHPQQATQQVTWHRHAVVRRTVPGSEKFWDDREGHLLLYIIIWMRYAPASSCAWSSRPPKVKAARLLVGSSGSPVTWKDGRLTSVSALPSVELGLGTV